MERKAKEKSLRIKLSVGDWVCYKRTNEYVKIGAIHREDPEEEYYTLILPDGTERQTTINHMIAEQMSAEDYRDWCVWNNISS
jgi:hypothetical protein